VYTAYPLLVHCRLFGGHYAAELAGTLRGIGL
jgi:fructosamine-3-kinase